MALPPLDPESLELVFSLPPYSGEADEIGLLLGGSEEDEPHGPVTVEFEVDVTTLISEGALGYGVAASFDLQIAEFTTEGALGYGVAASFDLVIAEFSVEGSMVYDTQTPRPLAKSTRTPWQEAEPIKTAVAMPWQEAATLALPRSAPWQDGRFLTVGKAIRWDEGVGVANERHPSWSGAAAVGRTLQAAWQEGVSVRQAADTAWQEADNVRRPTEIRWQEALYTRRQAKTSWQEALTISAQVGQFAGGGVRMERAWPHRWQGGMRPPWGLSTPVVPPAEDPCYVPPPGDAVNLVFDAPWDGSADLLFICERHGGGVTPPATVVVPIKRVYMVLTSATLKRVSNNVMLPTKGMSVSLDVDSWTWSFQASLPGRALDDLQPDAFGIPVEVETTINGTPIRFIVKSITRDRSFGVSDLKISGPGRTAVLDAPFAPVLNFRNTEARTAQQLMADVLQDNGVPLDWTVNWSPTDWLVPAGVFAQQGTYINALNAIAGSIGAYIQPHNTDQALNVLLRYPSLPRDWGTVTPDFELPAAVTTVEGIEWLDKPRYNRVYVSGQSAGVLGQVTLDGTAGDLEAPMVTDALITHADAARQRGMAVLGDTGRFANVSLTLPVLAETGIIKPGNFVRYVDGGTTRIGITRSVSVAVGMPSILQTIVVETHE